MEGTHFADWSEERWQQAYDALKLPGWLDADQPFSGASRVALKTLSGNVHLLEIPGHTDLQRREAMENAFLEKLQNAGETQVLLCYNTLGTDHPDMISGNLRKGLLALDERNLDTIVFLWGGGDRIHRNPLRNLLPPKEISRKAKKG